MKTTGSLAGALERGRYAASYLNEPPSTAERSPLLLSDPVDLAIAPLGAHFTDPARRRFEPASIQTVQLGAGHVCGPDGIIVVKGKIVRETLRHVPTWRPDSCVAAIRPGKDVLFREDLTFARQARPGEHFVGMCAPWKNYSHWMCEVLPRLVVYLQMRKARPGLKLILPQFPAGSFQDETLQLLGIDEASIHRIAPKGFDGFRQLFAVFGIDLFAVSPLVAHAAWMLGSAWAARTPERELPPASERIYIHRRSDMARKVGNFDEIAPVLAAFGFRIVEFEDASLFEQIALMRGARVVIAEHGAGAANCMFCQPGAVLVELFNPACVQPAHWSLASRCGVGYGFMVGTHDGGPDGRARLDWNSDYTIDPARLSQTLARLLG
jgi:hypothetical protein